MKIKDFLNSSNWIKGPFAVDAEGESVGSRNEAACKWCLSGATSVCYPGLFNELDVEEKLSDACRELFPDRISVPYYLHRVAYIDFNEDERTTWEDVLKVLERADV